MSEVKWERRSRRGLDEHLRDVYDWWMSTHGSSMPDERDWCRAIAYERWTNGKPLLSEESPVQRIAGKR